MMTTLGNYCAVYDIDVHVYPKENNVTYVYMYI